MTDYIEQLMCDRYAQAALSVRIAGRSLRQPHLTNIAAYLYCLDQKRQQKTGKQMSDDHLRQEAVKRGQNLMLTEGDK